MRHLLLRALLFLFPFAVQAEQLSIIYAIDGARRGQEIFNTFNSLTHAVGIQLPEVAIQTTLSPSNYTTYKYISNGIIPYVQSMAQTPFNTLLIVSYLPLQTPTTLQYLVLPSEQVTAVLYFPTQSTFPTSTAAFTSTFPATTSPQLTVDMRQRAADIVSAVGQLLLPPYKTTALNQVWIQTTMSGPYNPSIPNGLLKNVLSITTNNSLLQVFFQQPNQSIIQSIILSPEQISQIIYIANFGSP